MFSIFLVKYLRLVPFLALPFVAWLIPPEQEKAPGTLQPEKINLALRRTADKLLRLSGDSTSRIPAIEQFGAGIWRVRLEKPFSYDELPGLLQESLNLHGVAQTYRVVVRRCEDNSIDLGYHMSDVAENKDVPCGGRAAPDGCHFIEVNFMETNENASFWAGKSWMVLLVLGGLLGFWYSRRSKSTPAPPKVVDDTTWLVFGNSQLDVSGQVLLCGGVRETLTFRETKLLRLFASNPDKLLEREEVLRQVWADEGVMVGRSVDVFVSRLRKKLAADPSVGIVAVHGVGYRLETGKVG